MDHISRGDTTKYRIFHPGYSSNQAIFALQEAARGSLDEMVQVISRHSGRTANLVQAQLEELLLPLGEGGSGFSGSLDPLEKQLEALLDDLNETLRPRIEGPVRQRPLLSLAIAAGVGMILGSILAGGRRS